MDIPSLDLADVQRSGDLSALQQACEEWGFFHLTGHGISLEVREALLEQMASFFALPTETKERIERTSENPWGFYNRELTKNVRDWKELFDVGPPEGPRIPQWPTHDSAFRRAVEDFYSASESVAKALVRLIAASLGAPATSLDGCFEEHTSYLRLNHYPLCDHPADPRSPTVPLTGALGISHHSDAGAVTVLLQDGEPGLQVERDGQWYDVGAHRAGLIINIGDVVQVWSNDRYKAPIHRVLANKKRVRYSAPFFLNPSYATHYAPLPTTCVDRPPAYRPIHWEAFRAGRAAGDYADVGEEVQIAHYRI